MRALAPARAGRLGKVATPGAEGDKDNADVKGPQFGDGMLQRVASWRMLCLGLGDKSVCASPYES